MNLTERLNVLIQATTLSQKSGVLTLDEAVKAKMAIDTITSGVLNQNTTSAINVLIEIAVSSQKKGTYTLKDAYMIYLAIEGIENELQNEVNRISAGTVRNESDATNTETVIQNTQTKGGETVVSVPPRVLKRKS